MLDHEAIFTYLDQMRESGAANMMGAATPVAEHFSLPPQDARRIVQAWMDTFDGIQPVAERVRRAIAQNLL